MNATLRYFHEPAERGRLCVIRRTAPHYTGGGDIVARDVELELAIRIARLLNADEAEPELLAFVKQIAARDPVFAKGHEKKHIAEAISLVAKAEGRAS